MVSIPVRYEPLAPPITNPLPDGLTILNRGFSDIFFIRSSRVIPLLAVSPVLLLGAEEFGPAPSRSVLFGLELPSSWSDVLYGSVIFRILCHRRRYFIRCIRVGFAFFLRARLASWCFLCT